MLMRRGVVGELLIVIVLLASVALLITTFTNQHDVPDIARASLGQLRSARDILSKAILQWLEEGVSTKVMACNGVYPVDLTSSQYADALRPYVQGAIVEAQGRQITIGDLKNLEFSDDGRLLVSLENGSIEYKDASIYAKDTYDKEYLFNVRLLLALKVAQDWLRCDAGNLSEHLAAAYGTQCFFGVKDPTYPNSGVSCAKKVYTITDDDRTYMMSKAITPQIITNATDSSIDALNQYFAGKAYCKSPTVIGDTGITCSYELEEMQFEYVMTPYTSWEVVLPYDDNKEKDLGVLAGAVEGGDDDYKHFMYSDRHVWALPANISSAPYPDAQMHTSLVDCSDTNRESVTTRFSLNRPWTNPAAVDVRSGQDPTQGRPILYVNTTRGSRFTVKVTCTDNRAALLGQPLQYTFRFRSGLEQSCGPKSWMVGKFDCGACMPKPAPTGDKCLTNKGSVCGEPYSTLCRDSMIWHIRNDMDEHVEGATPADVLQYLLAHNRDDLLMLINSSCGGIVGIGLPQYAPQVAYTKQQQETSTCHLAFSTVCCGMYGYDEHCADTHDINNPKCFFNADDNLKLCLEKKTCGSGQCVDLACNPGTGDCEPSGQVHVGKICQGGCTACDASGECKPSNDLVGRTCDQSSTCNDYKCDATGYCAPVGKTGQKDQPCSDNDCMKFTCQTWDAFPNALDCRPAGNAPNGASCGTGTTTCYQDGKKCTCDLQCVSGSCSEVNAHSCSGGGGGTDCNPTSDPNCT